MNTDDDLRKKEKKLDCSHWMCRVQKYTFGIDAPSFYSGYCPFFWMTWVCVLMSPFAFFWNVALKPIGRVLNKIGDDVVSRKEASTKRLLETPLQPSAADFLALERYYRHDKPDIDYSSNDVFHSLDRSSVDAIRIALWLNQNKDWRNTHLPAAHQWKIEMNKRKEAANNRKHKIRKIGNVVSVCGSTVFKGLIPALIAALSYVAYLGIYWVCSVVTLNAFLIALGIVLAGLTVGLVTHVVFDVLHNIRMNRMSKPTEPKPVYEGPRWYEPIVDGISNGFAFIRDTVRMTYKKECPMIIWGDETGKIQKRAKKTVEDLG